MEYKNQQQSISDNEYNYQPVSIIAIWKILFKSKIIIISSTIVFSILAVMYALNATPIYRAELLMVAAQGGATGGLSSLSGQYGSLARLAGINLSDSQAGDTERAFAILQSRTFTEQYIEEKNLLPVLFADDWDENTNTWKDGESPSAQAAYRVVNSMLSVYRDSETGLISLSVEWPDPEFAASWANETVSRLNAYIRNQVIEETEKNIFFLQEQSKKTSVVNAQTALYNLIEEQMKVIMLANVKDEYAFKVIDPAVAPDMRIKPKRTQMVMAGFIFGVLFGLIAVFIKEFFNKVKNSTNPI